jgi:hypothetical protein
MNRPFGQDEKGVGLHPQLSLSSRYEQKFDRTSELDAPPALISTEVVVVELRWKR